MHIDLYSLRVFLRLHEVAVALCGALHLRANNLLPPDLLFTVFKAAAFQPSQDAAAAAAAATAQSVLLGSGAPKETINAGPSGPAHDADVMPMTPSAATSVAASADACSPMGPSRSGSLAENASSQQQQPLAPQRHQRQWQPLRPRAVPPLTEGEQQFVFNPYPNPDGGGPQGGPTGAPDTRGLEAQVSATIVCSAPFKYVCNTGHGANGGPHCTLLMAGPRYPL